VEVIGFGMIDFHIGVLKFQDKEQVDKIKVEVEDEMLSQLSVHTANNVPTKAFVKKLVKEEAY
jgi:hypothetical protein